MIATALATLALAGSAICSPVASPAADPTRGVADLEDLYRSGVPFAAFYAAVDQRAGLWESHYTQGAVDPDLVDRLAALPGRWRILAIAEDWCSDSANTIPYLALLTERLENVEMRVVDSDAGRAVMEAHRTPDGRAATPTVVLLDERFEEVGCWVERPASLQDWALGEGARLDGRAFMTRKMGWYQDDAGRSTVREIVALLEAAADGAAICPGR